MWAIQQLFPIMPIHRLDEQPTVSAMLADLTCGERFSCAPALPLLAFTIQSDHHTIRSGLTYVITAQSLSLVPIGIQPNSLGVLNASFVRRL